MRKVLIIVMPVMALVLVASSAISHAPASDPASADQFFDAGRYADAAVLYQSALSRSPKGKDAVLQQANLVVCELCLKDAKVAKAAIETFVAGYAADPGFRQAARRIGDNLRWRNIDAETARQMYAIAASGDPYPEMLWARMGLAISCVRLKDYEAAAPVVQSLMADFPDDSRLGQAICHTGDAYRDARRHTEAVELYQYVINHLPQDEYAMWSQAGIAVSAIVRYDPPSATAAVEKLRANYLGREKYAAALCVVADNYRWREQYDKARDLYLAALAADPTDTGDIWRPAGLGISAIGSNDPDTAYAALATLTAKYSTDPAFAHALHEVGGAFGDAGLYAEAGGIYKEVFDVSTSDDKALWGKSGQARLLAVDGNDAGVQQAIDDLIGQYKDNADLPGAIFSIAGEYIKLGGTEYRRSLEAAKNEEGFIPIERMPGPTTAMNHYYSNAQITLKRITDDLPACGTTAQAYFYIGEARRALRQNDDAIAAYQTVINQWPDYEYVEIAKNRILKIQGASQMRHTTSKPPLEQLSEEIRAKVQQGGGK